MHTKRQVRAAVAVDYGEPVRVERIELESPGAGEVLVEMKAAGVCRSDWHVLTGTLPLPVPMVLGHEGAGIVREVGPGVSAPKVGDPVVCSWVGACGRCRRCLGGQPELCERANQAAVDGTLTGGDSRTFWHDKPIATFSATGTLAEFAVVGAENVVPIPKEMAWEEAALLGCAVQTGVGAAFHAPIAMGDTVLVIGAGGVGLNLVQGSRMRGAGAILAADPSPAARALALELGATEAIDPEAEDLLTAVLDRTGDEGVDVAFEAVGSPALIAVAFAAARRGGTAIVVGVPEPNQSVDVNAFAFVSQEKTLTGSWYGGGHPARDLPRLLRLVAAGRLRVAPLIQRRYALDEVGAAFQDLASGRGGRSVVVF